MQKYNTEVKKAEDTTKNLGKSSDNLAGTLRGLFTLALVQRIAAVGAEMVQLGTEANQTEERFRNLTSTMGDYDSTMLGLRDATLNIVDDMHLQAGAMLLIQTAGIETNAELERMMNLITMTKKPSEDMTTAIQNFGLMLANNSILRLDSFGISASKVRARIIDLQATLGIDRSEAFRMAVLEEGEKNIAKFGASADAAGTSISRLSVVFENAFQDISQNVAMGAEALLGFLEIAMGNSPLLRGREANTQAMVEDLTQMAMELLPNQTDITGLPPDFIAHYMHAAVEVAIRSPKLAEDKQRLHNMVTSMLTPEDMSLPYGTSPEAYNTLTSAMATMAQYVSGNSEALMTQLAYEQQLVDAEAERLENIKGIANWQDEMNRLNQRNTRELIKQREVLELQANLRDTINSRLDEYGQGMFSEAFRFNGQMEGDTGVPQYLTQDQAGNIQAQADSIAQLVDHMHTLDEANDALYTDEELARADAYRDKTNEMADAAQNAADAFKNMSLSELLGQGGGGRLAEEMDAVIEKMKELGAESWEINNAQRAFDLRTGRESNLSLAFQDQIRTFNAQIYKQQGADAAVAFMAAYDETLSQARLMGIDTNNPDFVSAVTQTFTNPLDTANFDIQGFLSGFAPAATAAEDMNTALTEAGTVSGDLTSSMDLATASADMFAGSMIVSNKQAEGTATHIKTIGTELEKLSKTTTKIPFELEWANPSAFLAWLLPGIIQAVQGAGGVMPGTDTRASQSGSMVRMGQTG